MLANLRDEVVAASDEEPVSRVAAPPEEGEERHPDAVGPDHAQDQKCFPCTEKGWFVLKSLIGCFSFFRFDNLLEGKKGLKMNPVPLAELNVLTHIKSDQIQKNCPNLLSKCKTMIRLVVELVRVLFTELASR